MKLFTHLCGCVAVTVTLAAALSSFADSWFGEQENEGVFQLGRSLVFESRRTEALHQRMEIVERSMETKRSIVAEILAGRLTLHEAAEQFQEVNRQIKNTDPQMVAAYQMPVTKDGVYRQVIAWVEGEVSILSPQQVKRILAPLVKEYEAMFGPLQGAEEPPVLVES